jgi:hypothetical protein
MFQNPLTVSLTLILTLGCVNVAPAGLITPSGLNPGDQFRVVFVTNSVTAATSGDISTYDQMAATDTRNAGLDTYNGSAVTWRAIVSTATTDAVARLPRDNVPIYLVDGTQVAASGADLWNTGVLFLRHQIDESPEGRLLPAEFVWTGTGDGGAQDYYLGASDRSNAAVGLIDQINREWVNYYALFNETEALPVYGFSAILTVSEPVPEPVPEPSTFALLVIGSATLLTYGWRGRKQVKSAAASIRGQRGMN